MSLNVNQVVIAGGLVRDPETKKVGDNDVTNFTVGVNRPYQKDKEQESDYFNCVAWGGQARFIAEHAKKGTPISVVGAIRTGSYTNKEGQKVYTWEVACKEVSIDNRKSGSNPASTTPASETPASAPADGFIPVGEQEELPWQ